MEIQRRIVWDEKALNEFISALEWISQKSIQGAAAVEEGILDSLKSACNNPEQYPPDKYKRYNPGNYRAFEIQSGFLFSSLKMKFKF